MKIYIKMYSMLILPVLLGSLLATEASAHTRSGMQAICKYEMNRNFSVRENSVHTNRPMRIGNTYTVEAKSPKNTRRALYAKCTFDRRGQYLGIRKLRDTRRRKGQGDLYVPKIAKRVCKGEAASRWYMDRRDIRITGMRSISRNRYLITMRGRNYRGSCEVSASGHVYRFQSRLSGEDRNIVPRVVIESCRNEAAYRWQRSARSIRIFEAKRVGRDDYYVHLRAGYMRGECEANSRGQIYLFRRY